jgi:hypothetical protein
MLPTGARASTSRYELFRSRKCTYSRCSCDNAAIERGASMDVREYRVKVRNSGRENSPWGMPE